MCVCVFAAGQVVYSGKSTEVRDNEKNQTTPCTVTYLHPSTDFNFLNWDVCLSMDLHIHVSIYPEQDENLRYVT